MLVVAYPVMLLFWPWAQQDPIDHPLSALATFSHETFPFNTLFAGQYFPADLTALGISADAHHPGAARADHDPGAGRPAGRAADRVAPGGRADRTRSLQILLIATAILFPVCYAVAIKAVLFDGMRHFIFTLPPIALAAALVADRLFERLRRPLDRFPQRFAAPELRL